MKKVLISKFFNLKETGLHGTIRANQDYHFKTGDIIQDQNGNVYQILGIEFPCNPKSKWIGLRLKNISEGFKV